MKLDDSIVEIELNGKKFTWDCQEYSDKYWRSEAPVCLVASGAEDQKLNRKFIKEHAAGIADDLDDSEIPRYVQILQSMGAQKLEIYDIFPTDVTGLLERWCESALKFDCPTISPLRAMGYRVGKKGPNAIKRQVILRKAFEDELPWVNSDEYMKKWHEPSTEERKRALIKHLEQMRENQRSDSHEAIDDYRSDSEWLKEEF